MNTRTWDEKGRRKKSEKEEKERKEGEEREREKRGREKRERWGITSHTYRLDWNREKEVRGKISRDFLV